MTLQKLNIQPKVDNSAKKQMVQSNAIGTNETLLANEVNAIVAKTNELVEAYNFGAPITAFNFKSNVPTYADLANITDPQLNDGYGVISDGLVYVWNGTAFPPEGQGMNLGLKPLGSVEENELLAVNGDKVARRITPIESTINTITTRKNLFNKNNIIVDKLLNTSGAEPGTLKITEAVGWKMTFIPVTRGFHIITPDSTFNVNPRFAALFNSLEDTVGTRLTSPIFEVTTDIAYLAMNCGSPTVTMNLDLIQVEIGTVATEVVPYENVEIRKESSVKKDSKLPVESNAVFDFAKPLFDLTVKSNFFDKNYVVNGEMLNVPAGTPAGKIVVSIVANWKRSAFIKLLPGVYKILGVTIGQNAMFAGLFSDNYTVGDYGDRVTGNTFEVVEGGNSNFAFSVKSTTFTADLNAIQVKRIDASDSYEPFESLKIDGSKIFGLDKSSDKKNYSVILQENNILLRTSYDETQDIIQNYQYNHASSTNGNFSAFATYLIPKLVSTTADLTIYLVHNSNDSISALGNEAYWFILGQHGYLIPRATVASHSFVLGQKVKDENNNEFEIIHIASAQIYLAPKITVAGTNITRSWNNGQVFSSLSNLDGSNVATVSTVINYQVKPMLKKNVQSILLDGKAVTALGSYQADTIELIDSFTCVNPIGATFTGISSMSGTDLITVTQSYFFKGKSVYLSPNLEMKDFLPFIKYHGVQPKGLMQLGDFVPFLMMPKVKPKTLAGRTDVDWNYPTNVSSTNSTQYAQYLFSNNVDDLVNIDDMPDRTVQFHKKNDGTFGIGFASGLDLESGLTAKTKRKDYATEAIALSQGTSTGNKTYFRVLTADKFANGVLPSSFIGQFNGYFSYYKPQDNVQSYVVHSKDTSYIYIHTQSKFDKLLIDVDNMEGKSLEVVENLGIELLTDRVVNGKIYVKSTNASANYLVLKTN